MPVYVNPNQRCRWSESWPFMSYCRMTADTAIELQAMARKLWLPKKLDKSSSIPPHFVVPGKKREKAIELGAIDLSRTEAGQRALAARLENEIYLQRMQCR